MNAVPVFSTRPALQLPRPDRLPWTASSGGSALADASDHDRVEGLLAVYGRRLTGPARRVSAAGRSTTWLLETDAGQKILKSYKPVLDEQHILHEHSILQELGRRQFPAPSLNITQAGETMLAREDGRFALFDYLPGYFHYHQQFFFPSQAAAFLDAAGAALACLHNTLAGFTPLGKNPNGFQSRGGLRWRELDEYRQQLADSQTHSRSQHRALVAKAAWIDRRLAALDDELKQAQLERLIIHGDYGPYNLLLKQNHPVVIIDFELARLDWRLTDLATSITTFARSRLGYHPDKFRRFVQGYRRVRPLPAGELAYLPIVWEFLSLCRVIVCWQRSVETGQPRWLSEAEERLSMVDWVTQHGRDLLQAVAA